jgi:serine/threonine protein kinase
VWNAHLVLLWTIRSDDLAKMPRSREVIDDRFMIEQLAGFGGMGQIYRARDLRTHSLVALKIMHDAERLELERFAREAQVLATLSHPGIVRYVDNGITAEGDPYLVMEWLSGETLSTRLQRTQLTVAEALALGRRAASALGAVHRGGVVHRDIKPSNLYLRDATIDKVVLIDFGMARRPLADPRLTVTGMMLGTPGYIAPEQVYNGPHLDGRADIFSLGCVLYRCIAGQAPFRGPDALRMLVNGTPEQLPRLREFRPSIPEALDDLVARMLSRSPEDRPSSGDALAAELLAIEESEPSPLVTGSGSHRLVSDIMAAERRLMSLVLAHMPSRTGGPPILERERALQETVERHRGRLEILASGVALAILSNADAATDLAVRATRCAEALRPVLASGPIAVVTGREILGPGLPSTELFQCALEQLEAAPETAGVVSDELTASLVSRRFDPGSVRGAAPACVGREQELDQLEMIFEQCAEDRTASMVLLSGAEGVGKSRLGHEFLRRITTRVPIVATWIGQADALEAGAVFGLLTRVLRRALQLVDDEPLEAQRDKIRAWLARHPMTGGPRFAEVLGDLVGTPIEGEVNGEHGGHAPKLPSEEIRQVFLSFLRAECAQRPVIIVLDDLQWGDLSTIKLIYTALGALADQPLLVLALARTKVHEMFPQLWADRCVQEIRLRRLSRRASAQLIRQSLGDTLPDDALRSLVESSDRHAAYLDELIRAVRGRRLGATPATVLAMVQSRLEKLDPSARRVLRAASIFGMTFWRGGVEELLRGGDAAAWLAVLTDQGVVERRDDTRFPGEVEYRFQHALIRDAAYEMLTKEDRVAGHWLAGHWLEQVGETDAKRIEEHFERCGRGGEPGEPGSQR